jgi:Na+/melibiose symporter-like transporter
MRLLALLLFSSPHAPLLALSLALIVFLPPHFAIDLAMPLAEVSALFMAVRLFDVAIGPLLGQAQDATRTPLGRRRLWLAGSALAAAAFVWLAFAGLGAPLRWTVGLAVLVALYASFAAAMIAHLSWAGELRQDYHGRTVVLGAVQAAGTVGQLLLLALAALAAWGAAGEQGAAVRAIGAALAFSLPLCVALAVFFVREPANPPQPSLTFAETLLVLAQNAPLRIVLAASLFLGIAQGVSGGLFLFFFQQRLDFGAQANLLLLIYFVGGLAGVPLWVWLGKRLGKHRALQLACVLSAAATLCVLLVPPGALAAAAPAMLAAGVNVGAGVFLIRAMMADVVDEDELATGAQRSGLFFGLLLTAAKLGISIGPASYAVLALFGFDASLGAANSASAMRALDAIFVGAPVFFYLSVFVMLRDFPIDEARQRALRTAIDQRRSRAAQQPAC